MTPQIDHLGKISPVLRVSTHLFWVSNEIDGKTFIFQLNLGPILRVPTPIYAVSKEIDGKMFMLRVNLGM